MLVLVENAELDSDISTCIFSLLPENDNQRFRPCVEELGS